MSVLQLPGVRLHYQEHGSGPPLVLSHCLGGNLDLWRDQVAALSSRYRLILWDCRGHGGSSAPTERGDYGVQRSAHDLAALMDALGIEQAHVGGLSMGGGISACFAILYPQRLTSLMVMDSNTAAALPPPAAQRARREHVIELALAGDGEAAVDAFLTDNPSYRLVAADGEAGRRRVRDMISAADPRGFAHTVAALLDSDFPRQRSAEIQVPALVLAGEQDPAMAAVQATHAAIAGSRLVTLPGAGHLSNIDQPQAFNRSVLEFLAGVDAGA